MATNVQPEQEHMVDVNARTVQIQMVVQAIVRRFRPIRVILFGSYAYGSPDEDSDVDLMVITNTETSPLHVAASIAAAIPHPLPIDIIVKTPADLESALQQGNVFETEVVERGIVVYEAENSGMD
jgi:predicted nucleotidyltransferase